MPHIFKVKPLIFKVKLHICLSQWGKLIKTSHTYIFPRTIIFGYVHSLWFGLCTTDFIYTTLAVSIFFDLPFRWSQNVWCVQIEYVLPSVLASLYHFAMCINFICFRILIYNLLIQFMLVACLNMKIDRIKFRIICFIIKQGDTVWQFQ